MVIIRMSRGGAKKRPFYRIVVTDNRKSRDGLPIERIGFFNPLAQNDEEKLRLDIKRINYWISVGAQISKRVQSLFKNKNRYIKKN